MKKSVSIFVFTLLFATQVFAHEDHANHADFAFGEWPEDALSAEFGDSKEFRACTKASASQLRTVNLGNEKADDFLDGCYEYTGNSPWCKEVMRPNPASINTFRCTYGQNQPHQLVHPDESTWINAYKAVKLVEDLEAQNICVQQIYNWWRPVPYNGNVGGAAGRHPYGTSVDVRFCTLSDMEKAFTKLCAYRRQGRLRALGYYGSTGLHLGVGDRTANTWGKSCN